MPCPRCHTPTDPTHNFCPHCGYSLRSSTTPPPVPLRLLLYLFCFFFPPFGLAPAIRYLRRPDPLFRRIGLICLILTIISLVATIAISLAFMSYLSSLYTDIYSIY